MRLRSLLFVPGDRPDRMEKALASGADALILDLEDAVAPGAKDAARQEIATFLAAGRRPLRLFVRINPVELGMVDADIAAAQGADGLVVPKVEGRAVIDRLAAHPACRGLPLLPLTNETPLAPFRLGELADVAEHLCGITWGGEDLTVGLGATASRDLQGEHTPPFALVRSLTLLAARGAGVAPIDTVFPAIKDLDGLAAYALRARRDGFAGMLAIHPAQVPVINAAFTPSEEERAQARAIIALFEANPGAGALSLNGKMVDAPHLRLAQNILLES